MTEAETTRPKVLITGCSGLIGSRVIQRLRDEYTLIGLDRDPVQDELVEDIDWIKVDLTDDGSVAQAMADCRERHGDELCSVIHLAAYYDFSGEPSPLYQQLTVEGTARLLAHLQPMKVEQLIFSSSLLVMKSSENDDLIVETSPIDAEWDYPKSKVAAERVIAEHRGDIPAVILRAAGVYDEDCHSLPLSQHISRIYEQQLESYLFPGDVHHGQSFVHLDDLADCFAQTIAHRRELGEYELFLIGEEDVVSYEELQDELGTMLHGREWPTLRIPKVVAKAGAWAIEKLTSSDDDKPFIKPWMIELADQNYPVSNRMARKKLHWQPQHSLRATLPKMIARLQHDPVRWYQVNGLPLPESLKLKAKVE